MATQIVPPQVVPFRQATKEVSQAQLAAILTLTGQIAELKKQLEAAEAEVQANLEVGYPLEPGLLKAWLKTVERRSVAWKAVCERELGEDYCGRVLAATKPDSFTHLVVTA